MRKYKKIPQTIYAMKFIAKITHNTIDSRPIKIYENKKHDFEITAQASYCPTTDVYRGQVYYLVYSDITGDRKIKLNNGDYIVSSMKDGHISVLRAESFEKEYRLSKIRSRKTL